MLSAIEKLKWIALDNTFGNNQWMEKDLTLVGKFSSLWLKNISVIKVYVDIECAWNWKLLVPKKVEAFSVSYELYLCHKENVLFIQNLLVTLKLFYQ